VFQEESMRPLTSGVQSILGHFGYKISRIDSGRVGSHGLRQNGKHLSSVEAVWPLPRRNVSMTDDRIRQEFARYESWHYAYSFEGGLSFEVRTPHRGPLTHDSQRHLLRYRHFMPYLLESQKGSLKGKRVLDIACNSGFWSLQCALLGADVVGFDARPELIQQANLIKSIVGVKNVDYRLLDFWDMTPAALDGQFHVVLNLGILYHLPSPLEALKRTTAMAKDCILLDTEIYPANEAAIQLRWEEPQSIRSANRSGIVALPSRKGLELMFKDLGATEWFEVPLHAADMPHDYANGHRASWVITM
jgi:2-polyprenyl-3-methyl-5-hydroxy-6-metoxy-1,4-benzoquinol methylase